MPVFQGSRYIKRVVYGIESGGQLKRVLMMFDLLTEDTFDTLEFREHRVVEGDRFDTLAAKYGGDATKWWVIAELNGFVGFPLDIVPGTTLKIPPQSYFEEVV